MVLGQNRPMIASILVSQQTLALLHSEACEHGPMRWRCSRSTACTPLAHDQVAMRQRVKCVMDANGYAIYFSRSTIPGNKVRSVQIPYQVAGNAGGQGWIVQRVSFVNMHA